MTWGVAVVENDDLLQEPPKQQQFQEAQQYPTKKLLLHEERTLDFHQLLPPVQLLTKQDETTDPLMTEQQQQSQSQSQSQQDVLDSPHSITTSSTLSEDSVECTSFALAMALASAIVPPSPVSPQQPRPVCHVLIPDLLEHEAARTQEEAFTHNYGKLEYLNEVRQVCCDLGFDTRVHPVRMNNFRETIESFAFPKQTEEQNVVFSLCDGNEFDGFPGASVAEYLENHGYRFAGCDSSFLRSTTDKTFMKQLFRRAGISTPPSVTIEDAWDPEVHFKLLAEMHFPLLVKLGDSYGSIGLTEKSIVYDLQQAEAHIKHMLAENFKLLIVEEFIKGPEFTVLVVGDKIQTNPDSCLHVYSPAERVFDSSLGPMQRWLSYQLVWVELGKRYNYAAVQDPADEEELLQIARQAYISVGGNSFGRVDIRKSERTGKFYVLEVNASCGIGYDSSSDCILRLHGHCTLEFLSRVLSSARCLSKSIE